VFIVFALFRGTHGLFVGWLKGAVMFALVPLFTVLIGGAALALLAPIVAELAGGAITMRAAVTMFLGASVYVALMILVLKVSSTTVAGWRIGRGREAESTGGRGAAGRDAAGASSHSSTAASPAGDERSAPSASPLVSDRVRAIVGSSHVAANDAGPLAGADRRTPLLAASVRGHAAEPASARAHLQDRRVQGVGTRFRSPAPPKKPTGKPVP
jgi:type IV secretion system protein VirB6